MTTKPEKAKRIRCPNGHTIGEVYADGRFSSRRHKREVCVYPVEHAEIRLTVVCDRCAEATEICLEATKIEKNNNFSKKGL